MSRHPSKVLKVDTGHILLIDGEKESSLECLVIGDYGKEKNIKADFLGLTEEINGVPHGDLVPLSEKLVVTISTQYSCAMMCSFCDVPKVPSAAVNATYHDMLDQILACLDLHPELTEMERLNIHFARMGEPTWNGNVLDVAACLRRNLKNWDGYTTVHPVVSTMMPKNNGHLERFLTIWLDDIKNKLYEGEAGLQLSINTTDSTIRKETMPHSMDLFSIATMMERILKKIDNKVVGRKITLNFALTDAPVDAKFLRDLFDPELFLCKLTPMHNTDAVVDKGMITDGGYDHYYPYKETEEALKAEGFDVIVFIPSKEEDASKITCGNAILASGDPE